MAFPIANLSGGSSIDTKGLSDYCAMLLDGRVGAIMAGPILAHAMIRMLVHCLLAELFPA
jgi:hypothetical protein